MAITKLMCLKEAKRNKPSRHLQNCLEYILNPRKNELGLWVGGNCGASAGECYQAMMETKEAYAYQRSDKLLGRQGYHFVIALPPGEDDMELLMRITDEFCREYLGDNYEYVYSGHTDTEHKHSHIVFNSVSRVSGLKYHYNNGDWAKEIQPIVNRLTNKYGLSTIEIGFPDLETAGKNMNYKEWNEKRKPISAYDILKMDIDRAIEQSVNYESFLDTMQKLGYELRQGHSKKWGDYIALKPVGNGEGARAVRSYQLGIKYSPSGIKTRIGNQIKGDHEKKKELSNGIKIHCCKIVRMKFVRIYGTGNLKDCAMTKYQLAYARRILMARAAYRKGGGNSYRYRKDFRNLQDLTKEMIYLQHWGLKDVCDVNNRLDILKTTLTSLKKERRKLENRYAMYRKGTESLFFLYEKECLPPEQIQEVKTAYEVYNNEKSKIIWAIRETNSQKKTCEKILERMQTEREQFQINNQKEKAITVRKKYDDKVKR